MSTAYLISENIISSLGFTTEENVRAILENRVGITSTEGFSIKTPSALLSRINTSWLNDTFTDLIEKIKPGSRAESFTRLEKLFILSIHDAVSRIELNCRSNRVLLVLSTTKGNIDLLEEQYKATFNHKRLFLWELGRVISDVFGFRNPPLLISNACISGVLALSVASRRILSGQYDYVVVAGGDIISEFVFSGFQSFQAISPEPCKPYDISRNGLSLGEGCGTIILSSVASPASGQGIRIAGSATSNDANHISGPSRSGQELSYAINIAMEEAGMTPADISYISAHGTATPFNDEMESKAVSLSGLSDVPLNSFKGYWGHTLGAAGIIESAAAVHSMKRNTLLRSAGFNTLGVTEKIRVIGEHGPAELRNCLKTASGFGGCNAAIIFEKI